MSQVPYTKNYRASSFIQFYPSKTGTTESLIEEACEPRYIQTQGSDESSEFNVTISSAWEQQESFPFLIGEGQATHRVTEHHNAGEDYFTFPEYSWKEESKTLVTNLGETGQHLNHLFELCQTHQNYNRIEEENRDAIQEILNRYGDKDPKAEDAQQPQSYITLSACKDSLSRSILLKSIQQKFSPKTPADLFKKNPYNQIESPQCLQCKAPLTKADLLELYPQFDSKELSALMQMHGINTLEHTLTFPSRTILEKVMLFDIKRVEASDMFEWDDREKLLGKVINKMTVLQKSIATHLKNKRPESKLKQDFKKIEKYYKAFVKLAREFAKEKRSGLGLLNDGGIELLRLKHLLTQKLSPRTKR